MSQTVIVFILFGIHFILSAAGTFFHGESGWCKDVGQRKEYISLFVLITSQGSDGLVVCIVDLECLFREIGCPGNIGRKENDP